MMIQKTLSSLIYISHSLPCLHDDGFGHPTNSTPYTIVWLPDHLFLHFSFLSFMIIPTEEGENEGEKEADKKGDEKPAAKKKTTKKAAPKKVAKPAPQNKASSGASSPRKAGGAQRGS